MKTEDLLSTEIVARLHERCIKAEMSVEIWQRLAMEVYFAWKKGEDLTTPMKRLGDKITTRLTD